MTTTGNRASDGETASDELDDFAFHVDSVSTPTSRNETQKLPSTDKFVPTSPDTITMQEVSGYLTSIVDRPEISLDEIRDAILGRLNGAFELENLGRKGSASPAIRKRNALDELTTVRVLLARHRIVAVDLADGNADDMTLIATYVEFGEDAGTYSSSEARIKALASTLNPSMTGASMSSFWSLLRVHAPVVRRTIEPHLIPVANGVYDHARQELREFSSKWVFLSKIPVEYDPNATSPIIVMPDAEEWEVESWIHSLSDDEGVPELLWEVISAAVRSHVPWHKSVWFVAERGNNGKGTLIQLLRYLLGEKACSAVKFADFGHDFKMEPLLRARVNLVDENGVGTFAENIDDWKAATTGDPFTMNRKHKTPVMIRWRGFEIQCLNSFNTRTKDRSESFYRRLLIVPFRKWFGGSERKYIKNDYLNRPEVLRYVLKRALEMPHTELSNPAACQQVLDEYRGSNNYLLSFWQEFESQLAWDLVPFRFLHALYREWLRKVNPSGQPESMNALISFLREHLNDSSQWEHKGSIDVRPKQMMSATETLIAEYELADWLNPNYSGTDPTRRSSGFAIKTNYKGLVRRRGVAKVSNATAAAADDED